MPATRTPSVLMVFPWCLDRIGHGNIQRVLVMAEYLSAAGLAVDVVYQGNPNVPSREAELTMFRRVIRVDAWRSSDDARTTKEVEAFYGGYEPAPANFGPGTALTAVVRGLLDAIDYTAVLSSYAWTAPIYEPLAHRALRIVDLHDVISLHGERCEQATGLRSPYSMSARTEEFLWRRWDVVLAITEDEAALVRRALGVGQKILTVPHAVPVSAPTDAATLDVVYAGSDNPSNRQSVTWLLEQVWPRVRAKKPDAALRLVGLICEAVPAGKLPAGVTPVGFVEDPLVEIRHSAVVVAPYLYGSGLKLKVLEAAGTGRPIVTTTDGVEGTGLVMDEHLLVADDADGFAAAIVQLLDDPTLRSRLGAHARTHVHDTFSADACYAGLVETIRERSAGASSPGLIPSSVERRLSAALEVLAEPQVVVWGNGSHTRALLRILHRLEANVRCIVDKGADQPTLSPEEIPVLPPSGFEAGASDLIVLSSQSFESEMWRDVAAMRGAADAMALYGPEVTERLSAAFARAGSRV